MLVKIVKSNQKNKRFMAIFFNCKKSHFGQDGGSTYIDHHSVNKRLHNLKRHDVNED